VNHSKIVMKLLKQGQFSISRRHIEETRPWRGILVAHVRQALQSGGLVSCNEASAVFRGHDLDGRILELPLKPLSLDFRLKESWTEAELVHVMTAYIPDGRTNDMIRRLIFRIRILLLKEKQ
jgi:hypothetical protein